MGPGEQLEEWREISDMPLYEVSSLGRVRSWNNNRWGRRADPRILSPQASPDGYMSVCLGRAARRRIGPLVLAAFVGPRPPGMECAHGDGNPANDRLENLRWASPVENARDRLLHGTEARGERTGTARLSEKQARDILAMRGTKRQCEIAAEFGVSEMTISNLLHGKRWKHLTSGA